MITNADDKLTQPEVGDLVSLYCTLGRGMNPFVSAELALIQEAKILKAIEGKMFFTIPIDSPKICLTTAERILVLIYHSKQLIQLDTPMPLALSQLQNLLTKDVPWDRSIKNWMCLRGQKFSPDEKISARLNVKVSGSKRKIFKPDRLAGNLCKCLRPRVKSLDFVARGAHMSIDIHISDSFLTVGLALTSVSAAIGGQQHGLRSTTAAAIAMCTTLCSDTHKFFRQPVEKGSIVLDPMCGKGSIPVSKLFSDSVKIGSDTDPAQVQSAKNKGVLLLLADARMMPLRSETIDHIVCDLPFGLKFSKDDFKSIIPKVLGEMVRLLKSKGRAVLLFVRSESQFLIECAEACGLALIKKFDIMLGVLEASIFVFVKNGNKLT